MLKYAMALAALLASAAAQAQAVDFTLPDLRGVEHKLSDYRGKWVVVNYWATWCPPCLEEIPELIDFHDKHKNTDAVVLGVNFEDISVEQLKDFVESIGITYPVLRQQPGPRGAFGSIPGLPTSYLINPQGELAARNVGPLTAEVIERYMRAHPPVQKTGAAPQTSFVYSLE